VDNNTVRRILIRLESSQF